MPWLAPPAYTIFACFITYLLLATRVTSESLADIAGSSNTYFFVMKKGIWGDTGIWQIPLYRQGGYRDWTMLLKLDPGAESPQHSHPNNEEVFVIDGEFSDGFGTYPAGTSTRSPPGSSQAIQSEKGAILNVHLGGME